MRAYVGRVDHSGLRGFIAEDVIPGPLLLELVREWTSRSAAVVRAVVGEDDAEAIRCELAAARPDSACNVLLNRAREIVPLRPGTLGPRAALTTPRASGTASGA